MMIKISYVKVTALRVLVKSSGATKNGINLSKQTFLVNVTEVFGRMLLVKFPAMISKSWCKCGSKEHISLRFLCYITTLKDFCQRPIPYH